MEGKVVAIENDVQILKFLVSTQFDKYEVAHLRTFADPNAKLEVDPNEEQTRSIFRMEIKHLLGQNFIESIGQVENMAELFTPGHGPKDAKKHLRITERGRYYIQLYDRYV
jgi:hypothetical protein